MIRQSDTRVRVSMPSVRRSHKSTGRILRSMLCLALIACTVLGCLPERMAQAADDGRINASGVNIRTGAGTDYAVVGCLNYKDEIEVLGSSGNWYKVKAGSVEGYVFMDYVTISTDESATSTLRKGMTGNAVKTMQEKLISLGYLKGAADGEFGDMTLEAVKLYQTRKGLSVDGVAGPKTLNTLYKDTTSYEDSFTKLYVGAKGSQVKALQRKLIDLKYLKGSADGVYGNKTVTAVKLYQKVKGLEVDGIAGAITQKTLFADHDVYTAPASASASSLVNGSQGDAVKQLQSALIYLGYLKGSADGKFGDKTESAVRLYQKTNGLTVDGIAGKTTQNRIYAEKQKCETVVNTVKGLQGIKYVYGGSSVSGGFDCSGLTMYCYAKIGVKMGHSSGIQSRIGENVPMSQIRPGDLVGFYNPCGHVGIYIGNGQFIHAPQTGDVVRTAELAKRNTTYIRRFTGKVPNP